MAIKLLRIFTVFIVNCDQARIAPLGEPGASYLDRYRKINSVECTYSESMNT